jgi:2-iminobutanoate/2-iminopropanoate deaminase
MTRQAVSTTGAPGAVGPYSQAIVTDDLVFCSGQVGLDPATGELVSGGVEAEAMRVIRNLEAVLDAAGCTLADVVKTTCFLADIADFQKFHVPGRGAAARRPGRDRGHRGTEPRMNIGPTV